MVDGDLHYREKHNAMLHDACRKEGGRVMRTLGNKCNPQSKSDKGQARQDHADDERSRIPGNGSSAGFLEGGDKEYACCKVDETAEEIKLLPFHASLMLEVITEKEHESHNKGRNGDVEPEDPAPRRTGRENAAYHRSPLYIMSWMLWDRYEDKVEKKEKKERTYNTADTTVTPPIKPLITGIFFGGVISGRTIIAMEYKPAPPMPCKARKAINCSIVWAHPQPIENAPRKTRAWLLSGLLKETEECVKTYCNGCPFPTNYIAHSRECQGEACDE